MEKWQTLVFLVLVSATPQLALVSMIQDVSLILVKELLS
jgi:hypothetical protein